MRNSQANRKLSPTALLFAMPFGYLCCRHTRAVRWLASVWYSCKWLDPWRGCQFQCSGIAWTLFTDFPWISFSWPKLTRHALLATEQAPGTFWAFLLEALQRLPWDLSTCPHTVSYFNENIWWVRINIACTDGPLHLQPCIPYKRFCVVE